MHYYSEFSQSIQDFRNLTFYLFLILPVILLALFHAGKLKKYQVVLGQAIVGYLLVLARWALRLYADQHDLNYVKINQIQISAEYRRIITTDGAYNVFSVFLGWAQAIIYFLPFAFVYWLFGQMGRKIKQVLL